MKKWFYAILLTCFAIMIISCGNTAIPPINDMDYQVVKQTYIDRKMTVSYPQITKMEDSKKQEKINTIIRTDALYILETLNPEYETTMKIDYEIKYQSAELLSIKYQGLRSPKGANHPTDEFYTTNINMREGSRLRLKELVNIDERFVEKVKQGKLLAVSPEITFDRIGYSNDDLKKKFSNADLMDFFENHTFSYLTKDSLGISLEVSHAIGDHVELEVKYQDIAEAINSDNEIWKSLLTAKRYSAFHNKPKN